MEWRKAPTPQSLHGVINSLRPVIESSVKAYAGYKYSPVVFHRAKILAANAVRTFDPGRGASLKTHVANQLRQIQRMAPEINDPFVPAERFRQNQNEIFQAMDGIKSEYGREATDEEIADITGLPLRRVIKVRSRMRARLPTSVLEEIDDEEGDVPDVATSNKDPYEDWVDAVYHDLTETDRLILMYKTGYRGAPVLDNNEIARRLNLSPSAVSHRSRRIQNRLDEYHGTAI